MIRASILLLIFLTSCMGLEESERKRVRIANERSSYVYRRLGEGMGGPSKWVRQVREKYPWEKRMIGDHYLITKEFFRCRGSHHHPLKLYTNQNGERKYLQDCGGISRHSLPVRDDQEHIYPILIDLLNYLQEKTGKKVVITCGHRCPAHQVYADPDAKSQLSKHLIGGEVDFYVQGMEHHPEDVIAHLMNFYKVNELYAGKGEYEQFSRYHKKDTDVSTPPWYNKEVYIKLYRRSEGRDYDNRHPYPYISVQVRYDREKKRRAYYTWQEAFNGYLRW